MASEIKARTNTVKYSAGQMNRCFNLSYTNLSVTGTILLSPIAFSVFVLKSFLLLLVTTTILTAQGTVQQKVAARDGGQGVPNATVTYTLSTDSEVSFTGITDANGEVVIADIFTAIETPLPQTLPLRVDITVYNVIGQRIYSRRNVAINLPQIKSQDIWDGRSGAGLPVAAGWYFVRLKGKGYEKVVKAGIFGHSGKPQIPVKQLFPKKITAAKAQSTAQAEKLYFVEISGDEISDFHGERMVADGEQSVVDTVDWLRGYLSGFVKNQESVLINLSEILSVLNGDTTARNTTLNGVYNLENLRASKIGKLHEIIVRQLPGSSHNFEQQTFDADIYEGENLKDFVVNTFITPPDTFDFSANYDVISNRGANLAGARVVGVIAPGDTAYKLILNELGQASADFTATNDVLNVTEKITHPTHETLEQVVQLLAGNNNFNRTLTKLAAAYDNTVIAQNDQGANVNAYAYFVFAGDSLFKDFVGADGTAVLSFSSDLDSFTGTFGLIADKHQPVEKQVTLYVGNNLLEEIMTYIPSVNGVDVAGSITSAQGADLNNVHSKAVALADTNNVLYDMLGASWNTSFDLIDQDFIDVIRTTTADDHHAKKDTARYVIGQNIHNMTLEQVLKAFSVDFDVSTNKGVGPEGAVVVGLYAPADTAFSGVLDSNGDLDVNFTNYNSSVDVDVEITLPGYDAISKNIVFNQGANNVSETLLKSFLDYIANFTNVDDLSNPVKDAYNFLIVGSDTVARGVTNASGVATDTFSSDEDILNATHGVVSSGHESFSNSVVLNPGDNNLQANLERKLRDFNVAYALDVNKGDVTGATILGYKDVKTDTLYFFTVGANGLANGQLQSKDLQINADHEIKLSGYDSVDEGITLNEGANNFNLTLNKLFQDYISSVTVDNDLGADVANPKVYFLQNGDTTWSKVGDANGLVEFTYSSDEDNLVGKLVSCHTCNVVI